MSVNKLDVAVTEVFELEFNLHETLSQDVLQRLKWISRDRYQVLCYEGDGGLARAVFSIIARVQDLSTSFKLNPDGGWDGVRGSKQNFEHDARFEKLVLSCVLHKPYTDDRTETVQLAPTWPTAISNLQALVDTAKGSGRLQGMFTEDDKKMNPVDRLLKIVHKLFKAPSSTASTTDDDANPYAVDCSVHPSLSRDGWPLKEDSAAQGAMKDLDPAYTLVPLPAYTLDAAGNPELILPEKYSSFQGALVRVDFQLSYINIGGAAPKKHFAAEIARIQLLKPRLRMLAASPKKRRLNSGAAAPVNDD